MDIFEVWTSLTRLIYFSVESWQRFHWLRCLLDLVQNAMTYHKKASKINLKPMNTPCIYKTSLLGSTHLLFKIIRTCILTRKVCSISFNRWSTHSPYLYTRIGQIKLTRIYNTRMPKMRRKSESYFSEIRRAWQVMTLSNNLLRKI